MRYTLRARKQLHIHYVMLKNLFTLRYELKLSLKIKEHLSIANKWNVARPEGEKNIMADHHTTEKWRGRRSLFLSRHLSQKYLNNSVDMTSWSILVETLQCHEIVLRCLHCARTVRQLANTRHTRTSCDVSVHCEAKLRNAVPLSCAILHKI
jgi:hypothetical protein